MSTQATYGFAAEQVPDNARSRRPRPNQFLEGIMDSLNTGEWRAIAEVLSTTPEANSTQSVFTRVREQLRRAAYNLNDADTPDDQRVGIEFRPDHNAGGDGEAKLYFRVFRNSPAPVGRRGRVAADA